MAIIRGNSVISSYPVLTPFCRNITRTSRTMPPRRGGLDMTLHLADIPLTSGESGGCQGVLTSPRLIDVRGMSWGCLGSRHEPFNAVRCAAPVPAREGEYRSDLLFDARTASRGPCIPPAGSRPRTPCSTVPYSSTGHSEFDGTARVRYLVASPNPANVPSPPHLFRIGTKPSGRRFPRNPPLVEARLRSTSGLKFYEVVCARPGINASTSHR